jgi:hypothetical protein
MKIRNKTNAQSIDRKFHIPPDLPVDVLVSLTGIAIPAFDAIRFYGADETVRGTPALKLRPSDGLGNLGKWTILDHLNARERQALGGAKRRVRQSTGCAEHDREGAGLAFIAYVQNKRSLLAARVAPDAIPVAAILMAYNSHLDHGDHTLSKSSVKAYQAAILPVMEYFGRAALGLVTSSRLKEYEDWRRMQQSPKHPDRRISTTEVGNEIATFRQAFNHFRDLTDLKYSVNWYIPARDTPDVIWWHRWEVARYLWACRGRIWIAITDENGVVIGGRWKIARDDDPTLVGPEGDRRVLRDAETIERRQAENRRVLTGINTASRHQVLVQTAWAEENGRPFVSFIENQVRRRPVGARQTNKRRPPVSLSDMMYRFLLNWAYRDSRPNAFRNRPATTVLHTPDAAPCTESWLRKTRAGALKDSGIDKPLNSLILRHTAAMWLKVEGISPWLIAEFLGCGVDMVVERYGTFDEYTPTQTANALAHCRKQKLGARRVRERGLRAA